MPLFMEFSAKKVNQIFIISKIPVKIIQFSDENLTDF